MNVTVFGATGLIGRLVVGDLLASGNDVTAHVRNPGKLGHSDPRLVTVTASRPTRRGSSGRSAARTR